MLDVFDLDGDGDIDEDDLFLAGYWTMRLLELVFDVTLCVIPTGAVAGFAMTLAAAAYLETTLLAVQAHIEGVYGVLVLEAALPENSMQNGVRSVLGIDVATVRQIAEAGLMTIFIINLMVIANGFYVGIRRASRKVVQAQDDRVCGCDPTQLPRCYSSAYCKFLRCCTNCGARTFQATFASTRAAPIEPLLIVWAAPYAYAYPLL